MIESVKRDTFSITDFLSLIGATVRIQAQSVPISDAFAILKEVEEKLDEPRVKEPAKKLESWQRIQIWKDCLANLAWLSGLKRNLRLWFPRRLEEVSKN